MSAVAKAESPSTRVQRLEALLRRTQGQLAAVTTERDNLRRAYRQLMEQFELLRRRIFIAVEGGALGVGWGSGGANGRGGRS